MKKGALDERLDTYLWLLSTIVIRASFPDAEVVEDGGEEVGGGDGAGDQAEVVEGLADVLGHKVGGEAVAQAVDGARQRCCACCQGFVVTGIRHYQLAVGIVVLNCGTQQNLFQLVKTFAGLGTDSQHMAWLDSVSD